MNGRLNELMQQLGEAITNALSESDEIGQAIHDLREAGYGIAIIMGAEVVAIAPQHQPETKPPEPKVQGDKVKPGTFTSKDESWARKFKISLDDPSDPPKKK